MTLVRSSDAITNVRHSVLDVGTFDPPWLRNAVLLLPREPLLFVGSISSNICYGRAGTPLAAIQGAGMAAGKWHFHLIIE
jgi:ATP-binding cassette subfamily B protein